MAARAGRTGRHRRADDAVAAAPVSAPGLRGALLAEWNAVRSARSVTSALGALFLLVVGTGTASAVIRGAQQYLATPVFVGSCLGLLLGQACVVVLGARTAASVHAPGRGDRRARVLALTARVFVVVPLVFAVTLASCAVAASVQWAVLQGRPSEWGGPARAVRMDGDFVLVYGAAAASRTEWLDATVGAAALTALLVLLALAAGALSGDARAATAAVSGLVVLPFLLGEGGRSVVGALLLLHHYPVLGREGSGWPLLGPPAAVSLAVLAGAYTRLAVRRRAA